MKPLILSIAFFFLAGSLHAQEFEIGLNLGASVTRAPALTYSSNFYFISGIHSNGIMPFASAKFLYHRNKWQYGASMEYTELSYKREISPWDPPWIFSQTITIGNPALPLKAVINRQFHWRRLESYIGLSAGYIFVSGSKDPDLYKKTVPMIGYGLTAGVQFGSTYFFTRKFGLNAEFAGNYMAIKVASVEYRMMQIPFMLGLRYKI